MATSWPSIRPTSTRQVLQLVYKMLIGGPKSGGRWLGEGGGAEGIMCFGVLARKGGNWCYSPRVVHAMKKQLLCRLEENLPNFPRFYLGLFFPRSIGNRISMCSYLRVDQCSCRSHVSWPSWWLCAVVEVLSSSAGGKCVWPPCKSSVDL
jgi:hypothetical protein